MPSTHQQAHRRWTGIAPGIAWGSAVVALLCSVFLIADFTVAAFRAPAENERIEQLKAGVKSDSGVAPMLHEAYERQTEASLRRKKRARFLAWGLLVSGSLFVAGAKTVASSRPQTLPSLDRLVEIRYPPTTPLLGRRSGTAAQGAKDERPESDLVDELVERHGRGREAAIPILQAIQNHYRYLPDEALRRVCERTQISPAQIAGTSSFYAQFRRSPVGRHVVRVCHGTACHVAGAEQITQELRRHLEIAPGADTDPKKLFTVDAVACVGCCSLAPVMMVEQETAGRLTPAGARRALDALEPRT
jgi:NADH:ubiquinone oxidoreductase subunit E